MKFKYGNFSCDVDIFRNGNDVALRFYDAQREYTEEQIVNCVIVDSGYGFLCLKIKGEDGLVSGYLNKSVFSSEDMVDAAIDFLEEISLVTWGYTPYHIDLVQFVDYVEYNGEY